MFTGIYLMQACGEDLLIVFFVYDYHTESIVAILNYSNVMDIHMKNIILKEESAARMNCD